MKANVNVNADIYTLKTKKGHWGILKQQEEELYQTTNYEEIIRQFASHRHMLDELSNDDYLWLIICKNNEQIYYEFRLG